MLNLKSLTPALGAIALASTAMTATAGSWPSTPAKRGAKVSVDVPATTRIAKQEPAVVRDTLPTGDFEHVSSEAGWQLRQHQLVPGGGSVTHSPHRRRSGRTQQSSLPYRRRTSSSAISASVSHAPCQFGQLRTSYLKGEFMKTRFVIAVGTVSMLASRVSFAQDGHMMDGGMWGTGWMGGYGGAWVPVLLVVIVGLVVWIARGKGK